ncbi:hypothetical protein B0J11DRAFT_428035 [Dendryphion nanum]|uniref:Rhodopsin domain-containing protein n=1 Tax=Dendryphion nanum TaxID=256645 RepID=A0A9P9ISN2_9PLEO|nr:hypothetical protein B0J11DRAFT_428035 [Dendryphion nanum]
MHDTQRPQIYALTIIFTALAFTSLCLRLYTRQRILRNLGADDIAIVIAQILSFGVTIATIVQLAIGGLGRHTEFASRDELLAGLKAMYSNLLIYNVAQLVTKISFLIQYRRLFPTAGIRAACLYGMVFLAVWGFIQLFITAFSCIPLEIIVPKWKNRCIPTFPVLNVNAVMNIVTDFMIFLIPCRPVVKLQMANKQKAHLLIVFCLGFFACVISIVRLHELHRTKNSSDPIWDSGATSYWSVIELNVGILCACLPTIRPFIKKFVPRLLGTATQPTNHNYKLSAIPTRVTCKGDAETNIYIHKEVEFQSTTELRSNNAAKPPSWGREDSMDETSIDEVQAKNRAKK